MAEIENYSGNSHKQKETSLVRPRNTLDSNYIPLDETGGEKKNEKIVKCKVERRKTSTGKKIMNSIIGDDIPNVKEHIVWDVIVPSIRDTIRNSLINIVESIFGGGRIKSSHGGGSMISYNTMYDNPMPERINRSIYDYDEIIFENRGEAEGVLQQLIYSIKRYGYVSILDYYDLVGVRTRPSDDKYGWINLNSASVERVNGGYLLRLPKAMPID